MAVWGSTNDRVSGSPRRRRLGLRATRGLGSVACAAVAKDSRHDGGGGPGLATKNQLRWKVPEVYMMFLTET